MVGSSVAMETVDDKKKVNDELLRFVRKRSEVDVPRYTAQLKNYVDLQQKRRRVTAAREHTVARKKAGDTVSQDGKPESGSGKAMRTRPLLGTRGSDEANDACGRRRRRSRCRRRRRSRCRRRGRRHRSRRRSRCRRRHGRRRRSRSRRRRGRRGRSRCGRGRHRSRHGRRHRRSRSRCGRRRRRRC